MPLTVCPLSNLRLCVVPDLTDASAAPHAATTGLMATINSDDPAYFGGYMNENLSAVALGRDEIVTLARNGFRAAFCDEDTKQRYLSELDAYCLSRR